MTKCNTCKYCYVNNFSDEAYCEAHDGERIDLKRGKHRPKWCPMAKGDKDDTGAGDKTR